MEYIHGKNVNDLFVNTANRLLDKGVRNNPRGLNTIELKDAWLECDDVSDPVCSLKARDLDKNYLEAELDWYKSGSLNVKDISKHSRFWEKLADTNGTINSNYGYLALITKFAGKSQFEWCEEVLKSDPNTRQAIINYNQPQHKYPTNKDFVCTIAQLFHVNDDKLDTTVLMRSNDLIYGLSYDLPWFVHLQKELADKLNIDVGKYSHYAASLHVYEKHFKMLEEIAKEA